MTGHQYPCIGQFRFLDLSISLHPSYQRVLSFLKEPHSQNTLLDLGCCFAQDIRKLVHDGIPSENLYACDLKLDFLDLGYELFKDRETLKTGCFSADVFQPGGELDTIEGKIDVIYAGSFFHLFSWNDQINICKRIIKTLKPQKGSSVFGRQTGNVKGRAVDNKHDDKANAEPVWRHDADTFKKMWGIAGEETRTRWKALAQLDEGEGMGMGHWAEPGLCRLRFEVERLE